MRIFIYIYVQYHPAPKSLHKTLGQTTENGQTTGQMGGILSCIGGKKRNGKKPKNT